MQEGPEGEAPRLPRNSEARGRVEAPTSVSSRTSHAQQPQVPSPLQAEPGCPSAHRSGCLYKGARNFLLQPMIPFVSE